MKSRPRVVPALAALAFLVFASLHGVLSWTHAAETATAVAPSSPSKITHSFLALGAETRIIGEDNRIVWSYPHATRDGWVLPNGNRLLTLSKDDSTYPGGAVLELDPSGTTVFEYRGTQVEVNTAQRLTDGRTLVTEAGPKPRLLELNRAGKVLLEVPLVCQTTNVHMQSRMSRKLPNGNFLVPQLLDKVVREYAADGAIRWEVRTPHWPFTAIRLPDGHTLIDCTYGNLSLEVDASGQTVWQLSNEDLPDALIKDACGAQRLPNGNTVIACYGIGAQRTKLLEVSPDKKVAWTYTDASPSGIHHFQILTTNGRPLEGQPLR